MAYKASTIYLLSHIEFSGSVLNLFYARERNPRQPPLPLFVARCCGFALLRVFVFVVVVVAVLDWKEGKVFVEFEVCL